MPSSVTVRSTARQDTSRQEVEESVVRLCDLAHQLAANPSSSSVDDWEEQLLCVVDHCLAFERDFMLKVALERSLPDAEAYQLLLSHIEEAASNPVVNLGDKLVDARILTIPVMLETDKGYTGGRIERCGTFEALCNSTKRAGIIGDESSVILVNYLYHPRELLRLAPSEVSQLAQCVVDGRQAKERPCRPHLGQAGWPQQVVAANSGTIVTLGYLLAVVLDDPKASRIPDDAEVKRLYARSLQWRKIAAPLAASALDRPNRSVRVAGLEPFYEGLRLGQTALLNLHLRWQMAMLLRKHGMSPKAMAVVVSAHGEKSKVSEVRLTATSKLDGSLILTHSLPLSGIDTALHAFARVMSCMNQAGIEDVALVPEVQPLKAPDGSGGDLFMKVRPRDVFNPTNDPSVEGAACSHKFH